ncbi:MAG: serine--tRNA ligase [Candidatus Margulisbacteria bacterium]|nr:serine--tRNA ligase [Candidatus Margulisiibacteriota bacterium]
MLATKMMREESSFVGKCLQSRSQDTSLLDEWIKEDKEYREILTKVERLKAEQNRLTPKGKPTQEQLEQLKTLSETIKELLVEQKEKQASWEQKALYLPNIVSEDTPIGKSAEDNIEVLKWGMPPKFDFEVKSHDKIGKDLDILDFERGAKLSGSRFTVYKGLGAKLERALINFMLDVHSEKGYLEILPPFLVTKQTMQGTGQLPKFEEDLYKCVGDEENGQLYLIPTAEVPLTNLYSDEIMQSDVLPKKFCAHTPCFRKEAGSYGKDTSGLIRQHQFNKVELVMYSKPEESMAMLEVLTSDAEDILKKLELPYRKVQLCSGDLGFSSAKTYDLEVWFPSQNTYREISSCSNFLDFQARRAKIRYRDAQNNVVLVHTLNGSGLAIGRTVAAILENYQQKDGSVKVPFVLQDYLKTEIMNIN